MPDLGDLGLADLNAGDIENAVAAAAPMIGKAFTKPTQPSGPRVGGGMQGNPGSFGQPPYQAPQAISAFGGSGSGRPDPSSTFH